jgi:hypothetical protein
MRKASVHCSLVEDAGVLHVIPGVGQYSNNGIGTSGELIHVSGIIPGRSFIGGGKGAGFRIIQPTFQPNNIRKTSVGCAILNGLEIQSVQVGCCLWSVDSCEQLLQGGQKRLKSRQTGQVQEDRCGI